VHVTVINTLPRPVPIDDNGAQIGGLEWAPVDNSEERVKSAIAAGHLRVVEKQTTTNLDLAAAFAATDKANAALTAAAPAAPSASPAAPSDPPKAAA
jgi:predicted ATPase with chaperone activity